MAEQVHNITDAPSAKKQEARSKIKKVAIVGVFAAVGLLMINDQVSKFRKQERKETVENTED